MTAISKNPHIDKLPELVEKYNNTINEMINTTPIDVKPQTHMDFFLKQKILEFKVGYHLRKSKCKKDICKRLQRKLDRRRVCY